MKKLTFLLTAFLSIATFAQKDELKALKKIYAKTTLTASDLVDYNSKIASLEGVAREESDKVYLEFYKANLPLVQIKSLGNNTATQDQMLKYISVQSIQYLESVLNSTLDYEKKSGKLIYTDDIKKTIQTYKPLLWNYIVTLDAQQKFSDISKASYAIYKMAVSDQERLYIAANYAFKAKDYDRSLELFKELNDLNYTGEATLYVAKNNATGQDDTYASAKDRDTYVKLGTHSDPRIEKIPSKRGDIYTLISYMYIEKNDIPSAKKAIVDARKANPDDTSLIITEADLYLKTNDFETYKKLISEALLKNPNDADLFYNLGVISGKTKEGKAEAEKNYLKAIEINPKYKNAYINLAGLRLSKDTELVEKMNKITGTSPAENKKYDALKAELTAIRKEALVYYEKAYEIDKTDADIKANLISIYKSLEMNDKVKQINANK